MEKAALFWSGGKDSAYALFKVQTSGQFAVELLVTTLDESYRRISMHGVREELLDLQSQSVDLPLHKMWVPHDPGNNAYERVFMETLMGLKGAGFSHVIFGDIFLEDLRVYREELVARAGLRAVFPLWMSDTGSLLRNFLAEGFKSVVCCINTASLEKHFLGKDLTPAFLEQLPSTVDPCGENGEYHSFCYEGPVFKHPIPFRAGEEKFTPLLIKRFEGENEQGFWFLDLFSA